MKRFLLLILFEIVPTLNAAQNTDADFGAVAEEFIKGYLNARPLLATRLGFHEYDSRADDFSRLALDAELQRLRRFEDRLRKFEPEELNARNGIDLRILQAAIANELFEFQDVHKFERNPMIYAHCADLNIYIARKFAPLEDRVRSLIAIESQIPNILIAGKTNLEAVLPRPHVELAIQIAHGSADFLRKDMVTAVDIAKDQDQIRDYVTENKIVGIPPNAKARVKETPQYDRATSFASMDTPGPFEKKATEAFYYVTPVEPGWSEEQKEEWLTSFNYYTADVTSIHEAYPGHYVQFLRLNASSANKIEKIFGSYAFIEGWAHYCEQMMLDQGFGGPKKPPGTAEEQKRAAKYRMAQASEALLRLCRLCVSVKMHTQGMSVDEATRS